MLKRLPIAALLACWAAFAAASAPQQVVTPQQFGGSGDFRELGGVGLHAGGTTLAGTNGTFTANDVGRTVFVFGAGSAGAQHALISKVIGVSADGAVATLQAAAQRAVEHATGGIGTDNAEALQSCWDASTARGLTCYMQGGRYLFAASALVLRTHVRAEGNTPEQTSLVCAPGLRECVHLDKGPVQFVDLENFDLAGTEGSAPPPGSNDEAQRAFILRAHGDVGGAGGGLWQSIVRNVQVSNFWGDEFALYGGTQDFSHPNQFLTFEDLELQTARGDAEQRPPSDSYRLRLAGQNAQIRFAGGQVHGTIGGQFGRGVFIEGAGVVQFEGVTCEWLDECLRVQAGGVISFRHGWVENVKRVAELGPGPVNGFFFEENYLANSCYDLGTHTGVCLNAPSASTQDVSFTGNVLASGAAPPDVVVRANAAVAISASYTDMNGTVRDMSAGHATASPGTTGRRGAKALSPWIAAGQSAEMKLVWTPEAFTTADLQADCVTVGDSAIAVTGIRAFTAQDASVVLENRDPRKTSRATVVCTAQQLSVEQVQGHNYAR